MTSTDLTIRCTGRAVDDALRPVGDICGAVYERPPATEVWMTRTTGPLADDTRYVRSARAAGWAAVFIAGEVVATCPSCRRPPAAALALLRTRESISPEGTQ